jgi:hypothetical protein
MPPVGELRCAGDALVHPIGRDAVDGVGRGPRRDGLQEGLDVRARQDGIHVGHVLRVVAHAPAPGQAERREVALARPRVVHARPVREALAEIGRGDDEDDRLRVGRAVEGDVERAPHDRARAVAADDPARGDALARLGLELRPVGVLGRADDARREADLRAGLAAQRLEREAREVELLALQAEGVARVAGEDGEVEERLLPRLVHADLPARRALAQLEHARGEAEIVEHLQRRRMEGGGAQVGGQRLALLHDQHGYARARQQQREHEADRPRAHDRDAIRSAHRPRLSACTLSCQGITKRRSIPTER